MKFLSRAWLADSRMWHIYSENAGAVKRKKAQPRRNWRSLSSETPKVRTSRHFVDRLAAGQVQY